MAAALSPWTLAVAALERSPAMRDPSETLAYRSLVVLAIEQEMRLDAVERHALMQHARVLVQDNAA